jgi:hypothetical protein
VLGSNDKVDLRAIAPIGRHHCIWTQVIHKPIDVGAAFLAWRIKNASGFAKFHPRASTYIGRACLQQSITKSVNYEIML